jgi:PAS domain S-box-containing protein
MTAETAAARSMEGKEVVEPRAKILIVDDRQASVDSMAAALQPLGEEVLTATSADAALRHLLKYDLAVIVLDVMMPGMDGFELASLVRQRERSRYTPIIFLTGLTENGRMLEGYRSGAVDYLAKPCDPEVLRSKVKIFVELAKKTEMLYHYAELAARQNRDLQANAQALRQALDRTLQMNASLEREIAERKRAENKRDQLAGRLGATPDFIETMAEGAVSLGLDGKILYCNRRFAALLARPVEALIGSDIAPFVEPGSGPVLAALFEQAYQDRATSELSLLAAGGELVPVKVALNLFQGDGIEAVAMVVTDLRDQRRNEEILAQGRLARQILEHALSGIAVCDPEGRVILASAALQEMCDCNPLFKSFDELFRLGGDDGPFSVSEVLAGKIHSSKEVTFRRSDGRTFSMLLSAGPISEPGQRSAGCVITLVDISEWRQVEETLRRSEKLAAAGRIAGTLAHEVNNPLTAVTNLLYLLEFNPSLDEAARQYLSLASSEIARVSHIVRSTLAFYRESSHPVPVNVIELVDNVLELFAVNITAKSLTVHTRYSADEQFVGYPGETRQAVGNLISNAIDAAPNGSRISVRVRAARDWKTDRKGIRIIVADVGNGIAREHCAKLFEPFFTTKGEKGTGLGLWVTQGIVHKHGGFIRVRSSDTAGRSGTVFSLFLPVSAEPPGLPADASQQSSAEVAGQHRAA